jgi:hypothetical protein
MILRNIRKHGQFARQEVLCPVAIQQYTGSMGGVDRADQFAQYYFSNRKTHKWNVKALLYLLEICKTNAFLLYKASPNHQLRQGERPMSLLKFTMAVAKELVSSPIPVIRRGRHSLEPLPTCLTNRCMPGTLAKRSWCVVCSKRVLSGKQEKKRQTGFGCEDCNQHLCLPDCFRMFHSLKKFD